MISFDCPACGKALIVPHARSGSTMKCPGCGDELLVPAPPPPSKTGRRIKMLFLVALTAVLAVLAASYANQARRPRVIRDRLHANLQALSPQWSRVGWEKCDPDTGEYRLTVYYHYDAGRYQFETDAYLAAGRITVLVNPSLNSSEWLARASFTHGEQDSFRYAGGNEDEKRDLNVLTRNLADALRDATR